MPRLLQAVSMKRAGRSMLKTKKPKPSKLQKGHHAMGTTMHSANVKQQAHELIDKLPDNATWDDLMRDIYERQAIERGLADSDADRVKDVKDVRAKYGLPE